MNLPPVKLIPSITRVTFGDARVRSFKAILVNIARGALVPKTRLL